MAFRYAYVKVASATNEHVADDEVRTVVEDGQLTIQSLSDDDTWTTIAIYPQKGWNSVFITEEAHDL